MSDNGKQCNNNGSMSTTTSRDGSFDGIFLLSKYATMDDNDIEGILNKLRPLVDDVFTSDFAKLKSIFKSQEGSYYHVFGLTLLRTALAAMTLDKSKFNIAMETAWKGVEISSGMRKKNTSMIFRTDADDYTDEECHAELVCAEMQAIFGGLCVVEDQSILGFIKGAFRVRSCFNGLKECERILANKTNWKSSILREEFEAGVNLGLGLFEMGISFMPRKFMILLELAGFSSNRSFGLEKLMVTSKCKTSLRKYGGMAGLVGYYLFIEYFYGLGDVKKETQVMLHDIMQHMLDLYPNSDYAVGIKGGIAYVLGNFKEAESFWNTFIYQTSTPRGLKYVLFYYKVWLSTLMGNWDDALDSARILKQECKWSRSLFCYMYAVYASLVIKDKTTSLKKSTPEQLMQLQELQDSMTEALKDVPRVKRHFGGKKAFHEKIVIEKSVSFLENKSKMILAHLDLMYLWNLFSIAAMSTECITLLQNSIDKELTNLNNDKMNDADDNSFEGSRLYLIFMRGVVDSVSGSTSCAREAFMLIMEKESTINSSKTLAKSSKHLIPQACFELGILYRRTGDFDEARKWFKKTHRYSGYLTESMITFRADCALKSMSDAEARSRKE
jgi:tetratricopeptide (TPR) repeat protein